MPVLFKGRSEYARNYKWNESFRSASFVPKSDQTADDAGLRSDQIGAVQEPSFTGKKKVWHRDSQVQSCLIWWPESDEDKAKHEVFASYPEINSSPIVKADKEKRKAIRRKSPNKNIEGEQCKSHSIEVSVTRENSQKPTKKTGTQSRRTQRSNNRTYRNISRKDLDQNVRYEESPHIEFDSNERNIPSVTTGKELIKPTGLKTRHTSPVKRSKKELADETKRETREKKTKQVSENIVLQHKAGLRANKPSRVSRARLSEYQQNFASPKFISKPSPLLSAFDLVHSSSPAIPPHSGIKFRATTEYIANYKQKDSPPTTKQFNATSPSPASPSMKTKIRDLQNPQKPFFTHARQNNLRSEYAAQFEANDEFQVGELRKMAEKNKQKHIGTHIDPNHLTQVSSPFNSYWEASSNGSTIKDENQEDLRHRDKKDEEKWSQASQIGSTTSMSLETEEQTVIDTDSLDDGESAVKKDLIVRKLAWGEEDNSEISNKTRSILEGRVTTPRLQEMGGARRTHLDLTTPSRGGALLISPSRKESVESFISSEPIKLEESPIAGLPTRDAQQLISDRSHTLVRTPDNRGPVTYTLDRRQKPSPTKNPLVKKESSPSVPAKTIKTSSPTVTRHVSSVQNIRAPIRGSLRNEEFQHCGPIGKPRTAPSRLACDDDALSIASSLTSARASDLLHRAEQRKCFWTSA